MMTPRDMNRATLGQSANRDIPVPSGIKGLNI